MSLYSGKSDLFDHISGKGGWFDKEGNPVKFGQEGVYCYYSDEMLDFIAFKKLTGGVIHQHKKIKLTQWNHEDIKRLCPHFDYIEHVRSVPDKRKKSGQREEKYLTYKYYDKEYNLKELNKRGIYITTDIHFDTLLDLIPYYPYIVSMSNGSTVYVSNRSFVEEELDDHLDYGWYSDLWQHYKNVLQNHYREIVLTYFNPKGRENVEEVIFDSDGLGKVSKPIDENFYLEWRWSDGLKHNHWTSPKIIDAEKGIISISQQDLTSYIGNKALVYYVEKGESKIYVK